MLKTLAGDATRIPVLHWYSTVLGSSMSLARRTSLGMTAGYEPKRNSYPRCYHLKAMKLMEADVSEGGSLSLAPTLDMLDDAMMVFRFVLSEKNHLN